MSENKSSASHEKIMPAGKPSSSFITESDKSGELGSNPISVSAMAEPGRDTSSSKIISDSGEGRGHPDFDGLTNIMPQGKPGSSFRVDWTK